MKYKTFLTPEYIQTQVLNKRYDTYLKRFGWHIRVMPNEYYRIYDRKWRWIECNFEDHLRYAIEYMAEHKCLCKDFIKVLPLC